MTWPKENRDYMLRSADDFQGFHMEPKEVLTVDLAKLILEGPNGYVKEKDWEFHQRIEHVTSQLKQKFADKYTNPVTRVRVIWKNGMDSAEIIVELLGGKLNDEWETK